MNTALDRLNCFKALALAAGLSLAAPHAFSQAFDAVRLYGAAPGKDGGTVGAAVVATYEYQGSDQRSTWVIPVLDYQWANGWFAGISNGIGYNFSAPSSSLQYGLRLTADKGRKESRASALHGLGDVDAAAEGGAFLNYSLPQGLFFTSSLRYGAGANNKGLIIDLGAGYLSEIAPNWHLGAGLGLTLANAHYMQSFFGVSADQSAASGYGVYAASAGARDARANVALSYSIDKRCTVTAALSVSSLLADAKDSPLTRKRSAEMGVIALSYAF
ncbi:MipA/OmpV family protein [Paucibacter sp. B2R-40]|uniref:MipA/OmpV family protein n=1 Tax=Paucibacter sp. B2R-40 TaxID=2893554 RepID=UPI0021E45CD7|nr:MipA/OmpV family protein [Paucibacter sp. B2R-40]MCV2353473.1 MipA/OmpV family protein [Paucibacter sp. B2R-40]